MLKTEKEEIATVVVQFLQKILAEERSLIVEEVTARVKQLLVVMVEQKLEQQKQAFQAELDLIKSQHHQQLEQLGQAVEQVLILGMDKEQDLTRLDDLAPAVLISTPTFEILDEILEESLESPEVFSDLIDQVGANTETFEDSPEIVYMGEEHDLFSVPDSSVFGEPDQSKNVETGELGSELFATSQSFAETSISSDSFDTDLFTSRAWDEPDHSNPEFADMDNPDTAESDEFLAELTRIANFEQPPQAVAPDPMLPAQASENFGSEEWDDSLFNDLVFDDDDSLENIAIAQQSQELESFIDKIEIDEPEYITLNIPEDPELKLTEFADLEAENDFWASVLRDDSNNAEQSHDRSEIAPPQQISYNPDHTWYLGIDFGYSAIRASLVHANTGKIYPLLFSIFDSKTETLSTKVKVVFKASETENIEVEVPGFKNFLRLGLPYQTDQLWQPTLQWTSKHRLTLKRLHTAAQELLVKVKTLTCHADLPNITDIIQNLDMVILGYPSTWSDGYVLNLREAVLGAGLVSQAEQVMLVDQAIAPLLTVINTNQQKFPLDNVLFIDSGAFTTSLYFSQNLDGDRSKPIQLDLDYAGLAINQDMILQLLYPQIKTRLSLTDLPKAGMPSTVQRNIFQQFLLSSSVGVQLLEIAEAIKIFFSNSDQNLWQGELMGRDLKVTREQLELKVIQPFIQYLNDEVDSLSAVRPEAINQIFKLGGTMSMPSLGQWLKHKFVNAQISQLPSCSVVNGLAIAPLHSDWLDISRQQYSDYFLLHEICALNLQYPISFDNLTKKLQSRGVNIKACRDRLMKIIEGNLPKGILPWLEPEKSLILPDPNISRELLTGKLFEQISEDSYQPNSAKIQLLNTYLELLSTNIQQNLTEPLVILTNRIEPSI